MPLAGEVLVEYLKTGPAGLRMLSLSDVTFCEAEGQDEIEEACEERGVRFIFK
jgi:hypothetical protein